MVGYLHVDRLHVRSLLMFERVAAWSIHHRWWAVAVWFAVVAGLTAASQAAGTAYHNDFSLPGTQSQQALDLLRAHSPTQSGDTVQVVVASAAGVSAADVTAVLSALQGLPHVAGLGQPVVAPSGTVAYATVTLDGSAQDIPPAAIRTLIAVAQQHAPPSKQVELGGDAVRGAQDSGGGPADGVGILAALIILVLLF